VSAKKEIALEESKGWEEDLDVDEPVCAFRVG